MTTSRRSMGAVMFWALAWWTVGVFGTRANAAADASAAQEMKGCLTGTVEIKGNVTLDPQCKQHNATLVIASSDTTLDCRGGKVDGGGKISRLLTIDSRGQSISNIEVRNCTFANARHTAVMVAWDKPDSKKAALMNRDGLYRATPHKVTFTDVSVIDAGTVGLYVDDFASDVTLERVKVMGSGDVGIYLEHDSLRTKILDSEIAFSGRVRGREGIAIDSSQDNVVARSKIHDNKGGGVLLYRNCSERLGIDPDQVKRTLGADRNLIESNELWNQKIAVWVAARQSANLAHAQCGNGYYSDGIYSLDSAKHNKIMGNRIYDSKSGITVEDDGNIIQDNFFSDITGNPISIGSARRAQILKQPVVNVEAKNNTMNGKTTPIKYTESALKK